MDTRPPSPPRGRSGRGAPEDGAPSATLAALERQVLWLSAWIVHHANHLREPDEVKVGGHQASCASMVSILTALYFDVLRPEDRVAVKPHASPVFHAIQYLAGNQTRAKLEAFRGYGGAQSYPSRTKDSDDVDFSTGSVGLGVAATAFASLVQDYLHAKPALRPDGPPGRMVALVGDAELDEGNVYEALQEGWKHDLRHCWWVIDYNRQSLDGVVREGLWERIEAIFAAFGWRVVRLRHGRLQEAAFAEPGGARLREWIERCPNPLYSALTFRGGAAWRARLADELGDQGEVSALLDRRSDDALAALMTDLGGHCLETLRAGFRGAMADERPTVFLAYTIKGWGTPLAGHKDNHAGLMTPAQFGAWREAMGVPEGREWDVPEALSRAARAAPFFARGARRLHADPVPVPAVAPPGEARISTQAAFGKLLDAIARAGGPLADRIVTMSPDVTVSTNLGPWVNRRGLFAREDLPDAFRAERVPSTQKWAFGPAGQHVELGIAEMNLFLALGAAGLAHSLFGRRLLHLGLGASARAGIDELSFAGGGGSVLVDGALTTAPTLRDVDRLVRVNLEMAATRGAGSVQAEVAGATVDAAGAEGFVHGGYLYGTWFLTGERRGYDPSGGTFGRVVPKRAIDDGGLGAHEVGGRVGWLDLTDLGPEAGAQVQASLVANAYLTKRLTATLDLSRTWITAGPDDGAATTALTLRGQIAF